MLHGVLLINYAMKIFIHIFEVPNSGSPVYVPPVVGLSDSPHIYFPRPNHRMFVDENHLPRRLIVETPPTIFTTMVRPNHPLSPTTNDMNVNSPRKVDEIWRARNEVLLAHENGNSGHHHAEGMGLGGLAGGAGTLRWGGVRHSPPPASGGGGGGGGGTGVGMLKEVGHGLSKGHKAARQAKEDHVRTNLQVASTQRKRLLKEEHCGRRDSWDGGCAPCVLRAFLPAAHEIRPRDRSALNTGHPPGVDSVAEARDAGGITRPVSLRLPFPPTDANFAAKQRVFSRE